MQSLMYYFFANARVSARILSSMSFRKNVEHTQFGTNSDYSDVNA